MIINKLKKTFTLFVLLAISVNSYSGSGSLEYILIVSNDDGQQYTHATTLGEKLSGKPYVTNQYSFTTKTGKTLEWGVFMLTKDEEISFSINSKVCGTASFTGSVGHYDHSFYTSKDCRVSLMVTRTK